MYPLIVLSAFVASLVFIPSASMPIPLPADRPQIDTVVGIHAPATNDASLIGTGITKLDVHNTPDDEDDDDDEDFSYLDDLVERRSPEPDGNGSATMAYLDCTGIEELCDANCYAILCENKPQILTKVNPAAARTNRRLNGVNRQPFKGDATQLAKRGVSRPGDQYVSAEEYPFASTSQGGSNADLFPALLSEQNTQKNAIKGMYDTYGIGVGDNFNLQFTNANTPYCNALAKGDYSVCNKDSNDPGPGGFDVGDYAYQRDSLRNQNLHFAFVGK